jgi:MFS family permease
MVRRLVLPVIVVAQFLCTSLWFAANAVVDDLQQALGFEASFIGDVTSAVQLGFIAGTLTFAFLMIADRHSPSRVLFVSALCGAMANLAILWIHDTVLTVLGLRFLTGFFLAGIYPVGMKIAADHHTQGLGKALGYLVGALVLGTAFPHLVRALSADLSWKLVLQTTSACAVLGGVSVLALVQDGPHRRRASRLDLTAFFRVFGKADFRAAAFGYFGHMWELYAFWAFIPVMLAVYFDGGALSTWAFVVIGLGGISCAAGGYVAMRTGSARVAGVALLISGACCALSPLMIYSTPVLGLIFACIWGLAVIADSPQFSTLVAQNAPAQHVGTALTIVNCIGFAITIISVQMLDYLLGVVSLRWLYIPLVAGPILGLIALRPLIRKNIGPTQSSEAHTST